MGLKEIEREIKANGKREVNKIEKENKETIKEIKREIAAAAKKEYEKEKLQRSKELSAIPKKIISDAKMFKRREINAKRVQLLEKVFIKAQEKIVKLDDKKKKEILENLIAQAEGIKNPLIQVDKKYAHLLKGVKKTEMNDFGVIIEDREGVLRIDNTLASVTERIRTKVEPEVAKILFG